MIFLMCCLKDKTNNGGKLNGNEILYMQTLRKYHRRS